MRKLIVASLLLSASSALAQHDDHHADDHRVDAALAARVASEVAQVESAVKPLASTASAQAAGFHAALGWIPTMGTHWINTPRMMTGKHFELTNPSQLMFSRVGGKDSLVGAAYSYFAPAGDTAFPPTFGSAPAWHEHENLAPPGQTLVMLHVWFVPSPDGPFAGTNPNLPFWALGLGTIDSTKMRNVEFASIVRRASLALAEVADSTGVFPTLRGRVIVRTQLAPMRDSVRALLPEFRAAEQAHDAARWSATAARAASLWDSMYAVYLNSTVSKDGRARVERYAAMLLGQHEH
jgi:hypothetical protein